MDRTHLTDQDWLDFETRFPFAAAFLRKRALRNEYARLDALKAITPWEQRRRDELQELIAPQSRED